MIKFAMLSANLSHVDNEYASTEAMVDVEWPGGDGIVLVENLVLSGAGVAQLQAAQGGDPITASGVHDFWAVPGNLRLQCSIGGTENGVVSGQFTIFKRNP